MTENTPTYDLSHWHKNFYLFLIGQFLSGITSMIVQYAIIWYLTKETGSATVLSLATMLGMLPMVLLSPFVGALIDRWNKKWLLIISDSVVALFAIVLSIVGSLQPTFPLWLVFVSLLMRSIAQTFQIPTIQSILPTMVPQNQLNKVNGQLGMVQSANFIVAPALGAFLFAIIPINRLILLDVLGAILGTVMLLMVVIPKVASAGEKIHLLADSKFGFQQLRSRKGIWHIALIGTLFMLVFMPAVSLYSLMTLDYFKGTVQQAGFVEVAYSVGALTGGALIGSIPRWKDRMIPITAAYLVTAIVTTVSGVLPSNFTGFVWFVVLNAISGLSAPFFNTLLMAMIQQSYPTKYLGRVLGVFNSLMNIAGPIGLIFAGPLADKIGVSKMFLIAGIGAFICCVLTWLIPTARNYDLQLQKELTEKERN